MREQTQNKILIFAVIGSVVLVIISIYFRIANKIETEPEPVARKTISGGRLKKMTREMFLNRIADCTPEGMTTVEVFVPDEIMDIAHKFYPGSSAKVSLEKNTVGQAIEQNTSGKNFILKVMAILGGYGSQEQLRLILSATPEQAEAIEAAKKGGSITVIPQPPLHVT